MAGGVHGVNLGSPSPPVSVSGDVSWGEGFVYGSEEPLSEFWEEGWDCRFLLLRRGERVLAERRRSSWTRSLCSLVVVAGSSVIAKVSWGSQNRLATLWVVVFCRCVFRAASRFVGEKVEGSPVQAGALVCGAFDQLS